jgi:hypothetical protein
MKWSSESPKPRSGCDSARFINVQTFIKRNPRHVSGAQLLCSPSRGSHGYNRRERVARMARSEQGAKPSHSTLRLEEERLVPATSTTAGTRGAGQRSEIVIKNNKFGCDEVGANRRRRSAGGVGRGPHPCGCSVTAGPATTGCSRPLRLTRAPTSSDTV